MPWAAPTHFASRWGLRFRRRPEIPATSQPVSWSAQIDPAVILFRSGPTPRSGEPLTVEEIRAHASFAHEAVPSQLRLGGERYSVDLAAIGDGKPLADRKRVV